MNPNKLYTPLRYPGGKSKFSPFIASVIETNSLTGGHYLEPFAGGAGVAFNLLFDQYVDHIHINDIDPAIYLFWLAVVNDTDNLLKLIQDTPINMEQWFYWRDVINGKIDVSTTEMGFATLFMNRTNRSGILKAGVIGGKNQDGKYKLDARFNKEAIAKRIEKIALHRSKITIYALDALAILKQCDIFLPAKSLIYLDPPYYVKGQGLYRNFYNHEDHQAIANKLQSKNFNQNWVVSYDFVPEICLMYERCKNKQYELSYTTQKKYKGQEIMFFSNSISTPNDSNQ
ncbi:MAG: DNA adenine methylase [Gilliamella sp.]|uniref:DNA adenine methylase n=1 Tax=Gilliamella sp. TaxID=1891236 RepID=UPI0025D89E2C|nr:DNA adenine methylase [Gilliamella sp.]MCO6544563.1 DNA adenine methylase [Gilliamella sp.]